MTRHLFFYVFIAMLFPCVSAIGQETGFTNRATELKAEPKAESATVSPLPKDAGVKVLARQSGWARVESDRRTGWLRTFHLRFQGDVSKSSETTSSGFFSWLSPEKRRTTTQTATIGIRGLSEEEMQNAKPNPAEFARMKSFASSKADGDAYGKRNKLAQNRIDYVSADGRPLRGGK